MIEAVDLDKEEETPIETIIGWEEHQVEATTEIETT